MEIKEVDVHAMSHLHLVRFGILQLSETKRPDYKASSCTATQFGQIISCASAQRCSTRNRVRPNTRVDPMRYQFCHTYKLCSASLTVVIPMCLSNSYKIYVSAKHNNLL